MDKPYTLSETELDTLDADTLWAYIGFVQSAMFFNGKVDEFEDQYVRWLSKLAVTDLHNTSKDSNR